MNAFKQQGNLLRGKLMTFSVLFHSEVLANLAKFLRTNQKSKIKFPVFWPVQFIEPSFFCIWDQGCRKGEALCIVHF